jgi:hypothetical protein
MAGSPPRRRNGTARAALGERWQTWTQHGQGWRQIDASGQIVEYPLDALDEPLLKKSPSADHARPFASWARSWGSTPPWSRTAFCSGVWASCSKRVWLLSLPSPAPSPGLRTSRWLEHGQNRMRRQSISLRCPPPADARAAANPARAPQPATPRPSIVPREQTLSACRRQRPPDASRREPSPPSPGQTPPP